MPVVGDPARADSRVGVLVCNLGTPEAPTRAAVRRYLAEFLSDPRVVELPRVLWWPVLYGVILNVRPRRSAHAYAKIWTAKGSPLMVISRRQIAALEARLQTLFGGGVATALAMRYGAPSIADGLDALRRQNAWRVLVVPLYPQYSASTVGSVFDAVAETLRGWRRVPELRVIADYHVAPGYIEALAGAVESHWKTHGRGDRLLMSFHGLPEEYCLAGDPYLEQCEATARALATRLELSDGDWRLAFQSRVGPKQWLQPYADETLAAWGAEGLGRIDVICPGFAADCLETLEEVQLQYGAAFVAAGGGALRYIPALNDGTQHIEMLTGLVTRHLRGWLEPTPA